MTMVRPTTSWQLVARTLSRRSQVNTNPHRSSHGVASVTMLGSPKGSTSSIARQAPQSMFFSSNRDKNDEDGWWGFAGDYIKKIRWKAAEEISSQLPENEKNRMMDKAKQEQSKTDSAGNLKAAGGRNQPSVEELLAEARAQEAQRVTAKYEEERKSREAEMERAVRKKLETDLELQRRQIAFEKWQQDLARETQREQNPPPPSAQPHVDVLASASPQTSATQVLGDHPILGPVVCDLGHKRVHLSTVERLAALPVWEKQRFFRHDRAKSMARDKAKTLHTGLPGVIGIIESKEGNLSIIDGQHRIGMLKILSEKKGLSTEFDFDRILVEVYTQPENIDPNQYATEIFQEINKAQPANLVDLPGAVTAEDLEIINMAVANLARKYRDMFSTSTRCRKPHVNEDNVRNELFLNRVIERHEIKSAEDLERWMEERNQAMAETFQSDKSAAAKIPAAALEKAHKFRFYLGLDSQWYDE